MIPENHRFWSADEFSHWGLAIKSMLNESKLWDESSPVQAKSYPPGEQLFQYFMVFNEKWSEALINRAQLIFIASTVLAIVGWTISSLNGKIIGFALIFLTPLTLGFTYGVLTADILQAFVFGVAAVIPIMAINDKSVHRLTAVLPTIFVLVIIKETSLLLGIVAVALVWYTINWGEIGNLFSKKMKVVILGSAFFALFLPFLLWRFRLGSLNVNDPIANLATKIVSMKDQSGVLQSVDSGVLQSVDSGVLQSVDSGVLQSVDSGVLHGVWEKLTAPFFPTVFNVLDGIIGFPAPKLSLFQLTLFLLTFNFSLILFKSKLRIAQTYGQVTILLFGSLFYLGVHIVLYALVFTSFESSRAAGLERYFSGYLIAWIAVLICLTLRASEGFFHSHEKKTYRRLHNLTGAFFLCTIFFVMSDSRTVPQPPFPMRVRDDIKVAGDAFLAISEPKDSVFFLFQEPSFMQKCQFNCDVSPYYAFRLEVFPNTQISPACSSSVQPIPVFGDCISSFDDQISNYDFLVLMNATKEILKISDMFKSINFDERAFQIFRVQDNQTDGYGVSLVRVATSSS